MTSNNHTTDDDISIESALRILDATRERIKEIKEEARIETAKAKAMLVLTLRKIIEDATDDDIRNIGSIAYWDYKDIANANDIASLVGVGDGRSLRTWVNKAYRSLTCASCGATFKDYYTSRSNKDMIEGWRFTNTSGTCEACRRKQHEAYRLKEQESQEHLRILKSLPYSEYLKSDHWQQTRTWMLKRSGYRCQICNTKDQPLHVHHRSYENKGQETAKDLIVLCANCHKTFHENGRLAKD